MTQALSDSAALGLVIGITVAALLSAAFAAILRGARVPGGAAGAAILAGLLAGVLLGPGVAGRAFPDAHRAVTLGAHSEQAAYDRRVVEARGAVEALRETGVTEVAIDEYEREALMQLVPLSLAAERARIERRGLWDLTLTLAGAALLALLPLAGVRTDSGSLPFAARRVALAAGVCSFLVAGGVALGGVVLFTDYDASHATMLFAAACAAGWFAPPLSRIVRRGRRGTREAFISGLLALASSAAVCLWLVPDRRAAILAWAAIGSLAVWAVAKGALRGRRTRRAAHGVILGVIAPATVALAASRLDPLPLLREPVFWWVAIAAIIASTDGRLFGAMLGARALERARGVFTARSVDLAAAHPTSGVGLVQAAVFAALAAGGPLDAAMLGAGVIGALAVEMSLGEFLRGRRLLVRS